MYDFTVFIGRFQPFHNGHKQVIKEALKASKQVIILIGSSEQPRSTKNPFTYSERMEMIKNCFHANTNIHYRPIKDYPYSNQEWIEEVQNTVNSVIINYGLLSPSEEKIALIGHSKDDSSFYLKMFPKWSSINVDPYAYNIFGHTLSSTLIRHNYFKNSIYDIIDVPKATKGFLFDFKETKEFEELKKEYQYITEYKNKWQYSPFPPIFVTVDSVVVQSGHVVLIERGDYPGKGLLALPGGFINEFETIKNAAIRELKEETKIKLPEAVLEGSIKSQKVFDYPYRSTRGRTITHAFLFELNSSFDLPKVKGSDDAKTAGWYKLSDIKESNFYEDHYHILKTMIRQI